MTGTGNTRAAALLFLALANLIWAANWVIGRALRDAYDPITLNFWRWTIAVVAVAPFALRGLAAKREVIVKHAGILALLALLGAAVFQSLVYLGLRTTTAVNAVLINSAAPLFILLCAWLLEGERATLRQLAGVLVSFVGILVIFSRGDWAALAQLEFHAGDAWILLAVAVWGVYSVLLKRRPRELGELHLLFVISAGAVLFLLPAFVLQSLHTAPRMPTAAEAMAFLYFGLFTSVIAFSLWNWGVGVVGPNAAGFTLHLLPTFGTLLAIAFLGETFGAFHAVGIATIIAGVVLATRKS